MSANEDRCCREKYWEELTDSEKIERLGRLLDSKCNEIASLHRKINELNNHVHVNDKMYKKYDPYYAETGRSGNFVNFKLTG